MSETYKYRAFISYSHRDRRWAEWLRRSLESYRIPRRLVGQQGRDGPVPRQLFPVYRDRDESAASSNLAEHVRVALDQSAYLVVVCSPSAVESRWVNEEILTFKRLGREDRIFAFIVAGEPHAGTKAGLLGRDGKPVEECFPPALRFALDAGHVLTDRSVEPVAADARREGDGREDALARVVAGILGVGFDDLRQRARLLQRVRFWRGVWLAVLGAVLLALGIWYLVSSQIGDSHRAAEGAWGSYNSGNFAQALQTVAGGLPATSLQPDLSSAKAVAAASAALYQNRRLYGIRTISSFAVSGDGRVAATVQTRDATIWNLASGTRYGRLDLADTPTKTGLALAPRTQKLATVDATGVLHLVDSRTGTDRRLGYKSRHAAAPPATQYGIAVPDQPVFSPDEKQLVFIDNDSLVLADAVTARTVAVSASLADKLRWVGFAGDGHTILAIGESGSWRWIPDKAPPQHLASFDGKRLSGLPAAVRGDAAVLLGPGTVQVVNIVTGAILRTLAVDKTTSLAGLAAVGTVVAISPNGDTEVFAPTLASPRRIHISAASADRLVAFGRGRFLTVAPDGGWDVAEMWDYAHIPYLGAIQSIDGPISVFEFLPGRLLTFSRSGLMRLWDVGRHADMGVALTLHPPPDTADAWAYFGHGLPFAVSRDGKRFMVGYGKELFFYRTDTGAFLARWPLRTEAARIWLSPDGSVAASQGLWEPVAFWALPGHRFIAASHHDSKPLLVSKKFKLYDVADVDRLAISPNGQFAAVGCARCDAYGGEGIGLFQIVSGLRLATLWEGKATKVEFRTDNEILITHDHRIDAFDRSGERLWVLRRSQVPDTFAEVGLVENPAGSPSDLWGLHIDSGHDKTRAVFDDPNKHIDPFRAKEDVFVGEGAALGVAAVGNPDEVTFWRIPPVRTARQLMAAICEEKGNDAPYACTRTPFHLDLVPTILLGIAFVIAFAVLVAGPFVWLSALIWRGRWLNLIGRGAFLALLMGVGIAFGGKYAFTVWLLLITLIVIPGLLFFALRAGVVAIWRRMIRR